MLCLFDGQYRSYPHRSLIAHKDQERELGVGSGNKYHNADTPADAVKLRWILAEDQVDAPHVLQAPDGQSPLQHPLHHQPIENSIGSTI